MKSSQKRLDDNMSSSSLTPPPALHPPPLRLNAAEHQREQTLEARRWRVTSRLQRVERRMLEGGGRRAGKDNLSLSKSSPVQTGLFNLT